ncbi:MAG: aminotransferase class V-fold PLP-dependent enzyme, partial [Firmicutes bacterium]|nr:aminotransferase class V-fold PLP-dependent enzyme [Bacillota bacterium]
MQEFSQIPIYLDNAATMKPSGAVLGSLVEDAADCFCNPMAAYPTASRVRGRMDLVKQALAQAWGVDKSTLCFLSGATEANNWVLTKGHKQKNACIVCSMSEHPSVYNVVAHLQATGSRVQYVTLDNKGRVDLDSLEHILSTTQVSLVSVMHLCGQTGAINDIARIVGLVKASNPSTLVHSDGVQAFGKFDCNLLALGVDFYTVSMHKVGGLKGVGVLYCKQGLHLAPLLFGGSGDLGG